MIIALPTLVGVVYEIGSADFSGAFTTFLLSAVTLFVYLVVGYFLIFRTELVMDKLRLLEKVPEDPIPLNIHRSTVLSISVLVVGILLITQAIPLLIRQLSTWYQYNKTMGLFNNAEAFDYSLVITYAAEIIIGLLFIGNQRAIVNFIELRQRRK